MKTLNRRRENFVAEYVKDGNATQAAIRAGYSSRSARVTGHRLLTNAALQQRLEEGAQMGLEALIDVARGGKSESARVQASMALMDRGWGRTITRVDVTSSVVHVAINLCGDSQIEPGEDDKIIDLT